MNEKEYSVSEAVRRTGVPSHVLRYWEEELQITIHRSAQGYRIYTESDLELFRRVKLLKEKGIQLKAIRVLLEEHEDGQKCIQEQNLESRIREIVYQSQRVSEEANADTACDTESSADDSSPSEPCYEIVLEEQVPDQMHQFEMILKAMIEEVVSEQNERLEESLKESVKECLRDELEIWYMKYYDEVYREAAASAGTVKRSLWNRIFRREK